MKVYAAPPRPEVYHSQPIFVRKEIFQSIEIFEFGKKKKCCKKYKKKGKSNCKNCPRLKFN